MMKNIDQSLFHSPQTVQELKKYLKEQNNSDKKLNKAYSKIVDLLSKHYQFYASTTDGKLNWWSGAEKVLIIRTTGEVQCVTSHDPGINFSVVEFTDYKDGELKCKNRAFFMDYYTSHCKMEGNMYESVFNSLEFKEMQH